MVKRERFKIQDCNAADETIITNHPAHNLASVFSMVSYNRNCIGLGPGHFRGLSSIVLKGNCFKSNNPVTGLIKFNKLE